MVKRCVGAPWRPGLLTSPERRGGESHLFAVKHLDVLDDAAVLLQDGDGLGQRHPWAGERGFSHRPAPQHNNNNNNTAPCTHRGRIPSAHFLAIFPAPPPDPALGSGGSGRHSRGGFGVPGSGRTRSLPASVGKAEQVGQSRYRRSQTRAGPARGAGPRSPWLDSRSIRGKVWAEQTGKARHTELLSDGVQGYLGAPGTVSRQASCREQHHALHAATTDASRGTARGGGGQDEPLIHKEAAKRRLTWRLLPLLPSPRLRPRNAARRGDEFR